MKKKVPTILVVDDTVENLDILAELLQGYDVRDVVDGPGALQVVREESVDLILLDIVMPGMNGYEVCERLQSDEASREIPVIFITANTDEESIERAYDAGGRDYITKPFKPKELLARVRTQLELKKMIGDLEYIAFHDPLTGIYNRRRFFELATPMFERDETLFAVMADIDFFKRINDGYGHAIGDEAIRRCARTIGGLIEPGCLFGRMGGEEFVLLCPGTDPEQIYERVETIREAVAGLRIDTGAAPLRFTVSCGIAGKTPEMGDIDALLKSADDALYEAKRRGRNRCVISYFSPQGAAVTKDIKPVFDWAKAHGETKIVDRILVKVLPELVQFEQKITVESLEIMTTVEIPETLYDRILTLAEEMVGRRIDDREEP